VWESRTPPDYLSKSPDCLSIVNGQGFFTLHHGPAYYNAIRLCCIVCYIMYGIKM
jgi:hypothetical protein